MLTNTSTKWRNSLPVVSIGWLLFVVIDVLKKSLFERANTEFVLFYYIPSILLWVVFTLGYIRIYPLLSHLKNIYRILWLLVIGILLGALKNVVTWAVFYLNKILFTQLDVSLQKDLLQRLVPFYFIESIIISIIVIAILYVTELQRKYRIQKLEALDLKSKLTEARLSTLQMQLMPHFLFNTYNTIAMLVRAHKDDLAIDMISNMGDLLRNSLNGFARNMTSLEEEFSFVSKYLEIERIRHEGNLEIRMDLEDDIRNVLVPTLILQPIIENAFKHGFDKYLGPTELDIKIKRHDNRIRVEIYNTGPSLDDGFNIRNANGIGLQNTLDRLDKLYGNDYTFEISNFNQGVKVEIIIPEKIEIYDKDNHS